MHESREYPAPDTQLNLELLSRWDTSKVRRYLLRNDLATEDEVTDLELEYKKFLAVNFLNPGVALPVSKPVDKMWHAHVLFTLDYARMCEMVAGRFLHHKPSESEGELHRLRENYLKNTLPLLRERFGELDERFWPTDGAICYSPCE